MCKAQSEMGGAVKDANNPFFKSKYADLSAVVQAVKDPFANNGLSYVQFPIEEGGRIGVETILMHESGEWLSNSFTVQLSKQDAQGAGSAITYCRRYALQAIAGIPSEDDDGNHASKPVKKVTVDIVAVANDCGWTLQQVCESFNNPAIKSIKDIPDLEACAEFLRNNKI